MLLALLLLLTQLFDLIDLLCLIDLLLDLHNLLFQLMHFDFDLQYLLRKQRSCLFLCHLWFVNRGRFPRVFGGLPCICHRLGYWNRLCFWSFNGARCHFFEVASSIDVTVFITFKSQTVIKDTFYIPLVRRLFNKITFPESPPPSDSLKRTGLSDSSALLWFSAITKTINAGIPNAATPRCNQNFIPPDFILLLRKSD